MTTIIRDILQDLECTQEIMLALSDDIRLSIGHNEPEALTSLSRPVHSMQIRCF